MKRKEKTLVAVQSEEIMDENGEVKALRRAAAYKVPVEPDFVKLYTADVATLNGIKGVQKDVLVLMAGIMDYENIVVLSPACRKRWVEELGITINGLNNAISQLLKSGHVTSVGSKRSGEYLVDPLMFSKGAWKETVEKQEDFLARFEVSYKKTNGGYERRVLQAKVRPDGMRIDLETGKLVFTKRGEEVEKP